MSLKRNAGTPFQMASQPEAAKEEKKAGDQPRKPILHLNGPKPPPTASPQPQAPAGPTIGLQPMVASPTRSDSSGLSEPPYEPPEAVLPPPTTAPTLNTSPAVAVPNTFSSISWQTAQPQGPLISLPYLPSEYPSAPQPSLPTCVAIMTIPPWEEFEFRVQQLLELAKTEETAWKTIIGLYFQESGRSPNDVFRGVDWIVDWREKDKVASGLSDGTGMWHLPADATSASHMRQLCLEIGGKGRGWFEEALRRWAPSGHQMPRYLAEILWRAGWRLSATLMGDADWRAMADLKKMDEGAERVRLLAAAKAESPLFFEYCMNDELCGIKIVQGTKRHWVSQQDSFDHDTWVGFNHNGQRVTRELCPEDCYCPEKTAERHLKRQKMSLPLDGRPTQFHAVPLEERAFDSQGNRLPWSLEWHESHPNARHQKRQPPEEKGPFGKLTRRKGSSRGTRTTTPAKKENPTIDGFEQALKYDTQKAAEAQQEVNASIRGQSDGNVAPHHVPSLNQKPTQVFLHGYSEDMQWAAIEFFEKVSGGTICEDYERKPPAERRKYPHFANAAATVHSRALTKPEKTLACKYAGGECWIKVTFDSAEAADRALQYSPHMIQGHWVYAQLYTGNGPAVDEPIFVHAEDRDQGLLGSPKPTHALSKPQSSSLQNADIQPRIASTLPRSFTTRFMPQANDQRQADPNSTSPSTVSSATATATDPDSPDSRRRFDPLTNQQRSATVPRNTAQALRNQRFFTHFPDTPRNVIRPHTEAFLPQPSWMDRWLQSLAQQGWIPGDIIGHAVPRLENGDFDWNTASFYWKILYWIDCRAGTDICGLRDD